MGAVNSRLNQIFSHLDNNNDSFIELSEITSWFKDENFIENYLFLPLTNGNVTVSDLSISFFNLLDTNKDQKISIQDLINYCRGMNENDINEMTKSIIIIDENEKNHENNFKIKRLALLTLWSAIDIDNDSVLNQSELERWTNTIADYMTKKQISNDSNSVKTFEEIKELIIQRLNEIWKENQFQQTSSPVLQPESTSIVINDLFTNPNERKQPNDEKIFTEIPKVTFDVLEQYYNDLTIREIRRENQILIDERDKRMDHSRQDVVKKLGILLREISSHLSNIVVTTSPQDQTNPNSTTKVVAQKITYLIDQIGELLKLTKIELSEFPISIQSIAHTNHSNSMRLLQLQRLIELFTQITIILHTELLSISAHRRRFNQRQSVYDSCLIRLDADRLFVCNRLTEFQHTVNSLQHEQTSLIQQRSMITNKIDELEKKHDNCLIEVNRLKEELEQTNETLTNAQNELTNLQQKSPCSASMGYSNRSSISSGSSLSVPSVYGKRASLTSNPIVPLVRPESTLIELQGTYNSLQRQYNEIHQLIPIFENEEAAISQQQKQSISPQNPSDVLSTNRSSVNNGTSTSKMRSTISRKLSTLRQQQTSLLADMNMVAERIKAAGGNVEESLQTHSLNEKRLNSLQEIVHEKKQQYDKLAQFYSTTSQQLTLFVNEILKIQQQATSIDSRLSLVSQQITQLTDDFAVDEAKLSELNKEKDEFASKMRDCMTGHDLLNPRHLSAVWQLTTIQEWLNLLIVEETRCSDLEDERQAIQDYITQSDRMKSKRHRTSQISKTLTITQRYARSATNPSSSNLMSIISQPLSTTKFSIDENVLRSTISRSLTFGSLFAPSHSLHTHSHTHNFIHLPVILSIDCIVYMNGIGKGKKSRGIVFVDHGILTYENYVQIKQKISEYDGSRLSVKINDIEDCQLIPYTARQNDDSPTNDLSISKSPIEDASPRQQSKSNVIESTFVNNPIAVNDTIQSITVQTPSNNAAPSFFSTISNITSTIGNSIFGHPPSKSASLNEAPLKVSTSYQAIGPLESISLLQSNLGSPEASLSVSAPLYNANLSSTPLSPSLLSVANASPITTNKSNRRTSQSSNAPSRIRGISHSAGVSPPHKSSPNKRVTRARSIIDTNRTNENSEYALICQLKIGHRNRFLYNCDTNQLPAPTFHANQSIYFIGNRITLARLHTAIVHSIQDAQIEESESEVEKVDFNFNTIESTDAEGKEPLIEVNGDNEQKNAPQPVIQSPISSTNQSSQSENHVPIVLLDQSDVISSEALKFVIQSTPARYHLSHWSKVFSITRDGASFTGFCNIQKQEGCSIIVVKTMSGNVFGCFNSVPIQSYNQSSTSFYGTGECFVWRVLSSNKSLPPQPIKSRMESQSIDSQSSIATSHFSDNFSSEPIEIYRWSGENDYFLFTSETFFAIGGGSSWALLIDHLLSKGQTGISSTFENPPLCEEKNFQISELEVWAPKMPESDASLSSLRWKILESTIDCRS